MSDKIKTLEQEIEKDIKTARRCMTTFKGFSCDNKDCLNIFCPLNSKWVLSKIKELEKDED